MSDLFPTFRPYLLNLKKRLPFANTHIQLSGLPVYFWIAAVLNIVPLWYVVKFVGGVLNNIIYGSDQTLKAGMDFWILTPLFLVLTTAVVSLLYAARQKSFRALLASLVAMSIGSLATLFILVGSGN